MLMPHLKILPENPLRSLNKNGEHEDQREYKKEETNESQGQRGAAEVQIQVLLPAFVYPTQSRDS